MGDYELGGPYLQAAVFCEKVLQEKDGIVSLIRVVDRLIFTASGTEPPEKMPPVNVTTTAFLAFKSGIARGSSTIKIVPIDPDGKRMKPEALLPVFFEGDDRGSNVTLNLTLQLKTEGLYWFEVYLDERLVTRMPLRVVYQRMRLGTQSETP